ncbi:MAG: SDR family oxidoreductase [Rhodobiaceae bacterium]|nr:SDR family oxidoreductase [Rhodobiaceae bacterium]MCC0056797.1 SDR family oxidoreductase [Rhodobiaceae bacterium]
MNYDLSGRTMVVLGGTSEIGLAIVSNLTRCGANVVFQGTKPESAEKVTKACAGNPGKCTFKKADLLNYDEVLEVFRFAEKTYGPVKAAVCSGAPLKPGPMLFKDMTADDMVNGYNNRLIPRLFGLRAATEVMAPHGYGKVILISTDAGRTPTPTETIIGSAGAFVNYLARSAGRELARDGIRVNAVAITVTEGTAAYKRLEEKPVFSKMRQKAAFGLIDTADVANYVLYLTAPESDRISGSTMSLNGGLSFPGY